MHIVGDRFVTIVIVAAAGWVSMAAGQNGPCTSASACLLTAEFNALGASTSSAQYCQNGAQIVAAERNCLNNCNYQDPGEVSSHESTINQYCNSPSSYCPSFVANYLTYLACFSSAGGHSLYASIAAAFNSAQSTDSICAKMFRLRTCQNTAVALYNCPYIANLDELFLQANPTILIGLAVCGSEAVNSLAPLIVENTGCSNTMATQIQSQCNVANTVANAAGSSAVCAALQEQANCLVNLTANCTNAQIQYLLPRLDSYSISNALLGCSIQVWGLIVQPRPAAPCSYATQLNTCFFYTFTTIEQIQSNTMLIRQLLNGDTPSSKFCTTAAAAATALSACQTSFLNCILPHEKLFVTPSTLSTNVLPNIGVFPINEWGMNYLQQWVSGLSTCPAWSNQIVVPASSYTPKPKHLVTPEPTTTAAFHLVMEG